MRRSKEETSTEEVNNIVVARRMGEYIRQEQHDEDIYQKYNRDYVMRRSKEVASTKEENNIIVASCGRQQPIVKYTRQESRDENIDQEYNCDYVVKRSTEDTKEVNNIIAANFESQEPRVNILDRNNMTKISTRNIIVTM